MKTALLKNNAYIALGCVLLLIICSVSYSFYCKHVMATNLYLEAQSSFIIANTSSLVSDRLQAVDNCIRSFGLTKLDEDLTYLSKGYNGLDEHVVRISSTLEEQKRNLPDYRFEIDSLEQMLTTTHEKILHYYESTDLMISFIKQDSMKAFKQILAEQRGMIPWKEWYSLDNKTKLIQQKLKDKAELNYESAVYTNSAIQLLLLIFSLPTLLWAIRNLNQQEKKQQGLLIELDQNNRKHLFDDGCAIESKNAKVSLDMANQNIKKAVGFINKIGKGNYDAEWQGMTEEIKTKNLNTLAGELIRMRDEMRKLKDESDQRNWANEGLTILTEILRRSNDVQHIAESFLSALVNYVKANMGALYIVSENDNELILELKSTFACDKKKYLLTKIYPGQGLVGQVWLEKEALHLTDIPADFIKVGSGIGESLPRSILIVPIKNENDIQGIFELASFEEFKGYEIKFIKKIAENLATVLSVLKMNEKTKMLLEQSQIQAENLRSNEEEMRQNLEELEAAQEEMARKELKYIKKIEELTRKKHFS